MADETTTRDDLALGDEVEAVLMDLASEVADAYRRADRRLSDLGLPPLARPQPQHDAAVAPRG